MSIIPVICHNYMAESRRLLEEDDNSYRKKNDRVYGDRTITEEQLAEKYKEIISLECVISEIHNDIKEMQEHQEAMQVADKKIKELEAKLAESEKKKENFKTIYFNKCLDYEHLHEKFDDKCAEFELKEYDYKQTIFEKDQDKISFCIDKLEKVKELLLIESKQNPIIYNVTNDVVGGAIDKYRCFKIIDNQIKLLKEGK